MKLVPDFRRVVATSLSFWMQLLGLVALIGPEILYFSTGQDTDPGFLFYLGMLLLLADVVGRVIEQGLAWWRELLRLCGVAIVILLLAFLFAFGGQAAETAQPAQRVATAHDTVAEAKTLEIAVPFIAREVCDEIRADAPACRQLVSRTRFHARRGRCALAERFKPLVDTMRQISTTDDGRDHNRFLT